MVASTCSQVGATTISHHRVPELPDVTVYVEAIARRVVGEPLTGYAIRSVFALRSVEPLLDAIV